MLNTGEAPSMQRPVFRAYGFHPSFGGRTVSGTIELTPSSVRFTSDSGNVEMPEQGLMVRLGGHNSEQIFFEHPSALGWSIYTPDRAVLQHELLRRHGALAGQLQAERRERRFPKALAAMLAVLLLCVLAIAFFFAQKDKWVRFLAQRVPLAWEQNLGEQLFQQVKSQGRLLDDAEFTSQVRAVTERLLPVVAQSGYTFQFHILADTNINAFAIPGGHVVIHTGLLRAVTKPEELAGVLAHEIAHVTERHGFRKIIDTAGLYLLLRAVFGDVSGMLGVIADSSEFLLRQKYSRDFEREADDIGWEYLLATKINPRGMVDFFAKLKSQEGPSAQIPDLLSTHPATEERINRLKQKLRKLGAQESFVAF